MVLFTLILLENWISLIKCGRIEKHPVHSLYAGYIYIHIYLTGYSTTLYIRYSPYLRKLVFTFSFNLYTYINYHKKQPLSKIGWCVYYVCNIYKRKIMFFSFLFFLIWLKKQNSIIVAPTYLKNLHKDCMKIGFHETQCTGI